MKHFGVCAIVALIFAAHAFAQEDVLKWESFKAEHGKQYPAHEESERMQRFLKRDAEIETHNSRYASGLESFSRQHTRHSDSSDHELDLEFPERHFDIDAPAAPYVELATNESIPEELSWFDIMTPVKQQGSCGSGYAFAATGVLEAFLKMNTNITYDLSEQDIIDCSYMRYHTLNRGCRGGTLMMAFAYANEKGLVNETDYPYTSGTTKKHGTCKAERNGKMMNVLEGKLEYYAVKVSTDDELKKLLATKGPMAVIVRANTEQRRKFKDHENGVLDIPKADDARPYTAVVLVGYGTCKGEKYWLIKNSWGTGWGTGGYGKLRRGDNNSSILQGNVWYIEHPDFPVKMKQ